MESHLCSVCTQVQAQQFCKCSDPPVKLCQECIGKHNSSDRMKIHEMFPIETLLFFKNPGYLEAYRMRTGNSKHEAIEELRSNLKLLEKWKNELKTTHDNIQEMVSEHWKQQEQELTAFHSSLEAAIQTGIQEFESTFIEPSPKLKTTIAKGIRQFQPGDFRLLSACTDLEAYKKQVRELISESAFEVEMKPLLPDIVPLLTGMNLFKVVSNNNLLTTRCGKLKRIKLIYILSILTCLAGILRYPLDVKCSVAWHQEIEDNITYSNTFQNYTYCNGTLNFSSKDNSSYSGECMNGLKHGTGVQIYTDGSIFEGHWENGKRQGFGRLVLPDNYTFEGQWNDDRQFGYGRFVGPNDYLLEGKFQNFEIVGVGVRSYLWKKFGEFFRYTYIGEFEESSERGFGVVFINETSEYAGYFRRYSIIFERSNLFGKFKLNTPDLCRSIKEYQIEFFRTKSVEDAGYNNETWIFELKKAYDVFLVGMLFATGKVSTYLESIVISRDGDNIYEIKEGRMEIRESLTAIRFSKEIMIRGFKTYQVDTKFSQPNSNMSHILAKYYSPGFFENFEFHTESGKDADLPRYFRGFIYRRHCNIWQYNYHFPEAPSLKLYSV